MPWSGITNIRKFLPPTMNDPKTRKNFNIAGQKNGNQKLNLSDCLQPQLQMQAMSTFFHQNTHYARWSIDHASKKWSLCIKTNNRWAWMKTRMKAESWNIVQLVFICFRSNKMNGKLQLFWINLRQDQTMVCN